MAPLSALRHSSWQGGTLSRRLHLYSADLAGEATDDAQAIRMFIRRPLEKQFSRSTDQE